MRFDHFSPFYLTLNCIHAREKLFYSLCFLHNLLYKNRFFSLVLLHTLKHSNSAPLPPHTLLYKTNISNNSILRFGTIVVNNLGCIGAKQRNIVHTSTVPSALVGYDPPAFIRVGKKGSSILTQFEYHRKIPRFPRTRN